MKANSGKSVLLVLLMAAVVGCSKQADVPQATTSAPAQYVSPLDKLEQAKPDVISPQGEIAEIFTYGSDFTDLQRQLKFKEIQGKVIEWRLPVYEVTQSGDGYVIQTSNTNKGETFGPRYVGTFLRITPKGEDDRRFVERLKTGDFIEVKGVVEDVTLRNLNINPAIIVQNDSTKPPIAVTPQSDPSASPRFSDYPASRYSGPLHSPKGIKQDETGEWRDETGRPSIPPEINFAGKYFIALHGCGQGCRYHTLSDLSNGKELSILDRFSTGEEPPKTKEGYPYTTDLDFSAESSILIARYTVFPQGFYSPENKECREKVFVLEGEMLRPITNTNYNCTPAH